MQPLPPLKWKDPRYNRLAYSLFQCLRNLIKLLMIRLVQKDCWTESSAIEVIQSAYVMIRGGSPYFFVAVTWEEEENWYHLKRQMFKIRGSSKYLSQRDL